LFIYFAWKFRESEDLKYLILGGIIGGLGTLNREEFSLVVFSFLLWAGFLYRKKLKKFAKYGFVFIVFAFLTISPWVVRNYLAFHEVFFITKGRVGINLYLGNNPLAIKHYNYKYQRLLTDFLVKPEHRTYENIQKIKEMNIKIPDNKYLYQGDGDYITPTKNWIYDHPKEYFITFLYKVWRFFKVPFPGAVSFLVFAVGLLSYIIPLLLSIIGLKPVYTSNAQNMLLLLLILLFSSLLYIFLYPKIVYRAISVDFAFIVIASVFAGTQIEKLYIRKYGQRLLKA
jgi:hypothetical protein